jgi:hypothetical protein
MNIANKAHFIQAILDTIQQDQPGVIALALHNIHSQEEVAWSGKRTELSPQIGVAVSERMSGSAVQRVLDGFARHGRGKYEIERDAFTVVCPGTDRRLEHVAIRVTPGSAFCLSALFSPRMPAGLRGVVENDALTQLRAALLEGPTGSLDASREINLPT